MPLIIMVKENPLWLWNKSYKVKLVKKQFKITYRLFNCFGLGALRLNLGFFDGDLLAKIFLRGDTMFSCSSSLTVSLSASTLTSGWASDRELKNRGLFLRFGFVSSSVISSLLPAKGFVFQKMAWVFFL